MALRKALGVTMAGLLAFLLLPGVAAAADVVGVAVFYGTVTLNGNAAPAGTVVTVSLAGTVIGTGKTGDTINGESLAPSKYRIDVQALTIYEAQNVIVAVSGAGPSTTSMFHNNTATNVNLSATTSLPTPVPATPIPAPTATPVAIATPVPTASPVPTATHPPAPTAIAQKACVGDVNRDRVVDSKDLNKLSGSYGAKRGDAAFDASSDLNGDGAIDYRDLAILGANYGALC